MKANNVFILIGLNNLLNLVLFKICNATSGASVNLVKYCKVADTPFHIKGDDMYGY